MVPSFRITGNRLVLLRKMDHLWPIRKFTEDLLVNQDMLMHDCISGSTLLWKTVQLKFLSSQ